MGNSVKFALLTFFLFPVLLANAQTVTREYDVISNKEKVGSVVAVNRELNGFEHYLITCEMSVRMILKINVSYNLKASFKNGFLMSSAATMYLNGKIQSQVQVERSGTNYVMIKDGVTEIITEPIEYSSARLYFHLPDGDKKVFSETDGTFKTLKRLSTYAFEFGRQQQVHLRPASRLAEHFSRQAIHSNVSIDLCRRNGIGQLIQ
jgi:hypothetical protein